MQNSVLLLFLILAALSALIFAFVFLSSTKAGITDSGLSNPLRKRFWFLLILFVVLGILASVTIPRSPYFLFADENPSRVIYAAAKQFVFFMSDAAIDAEKIRLPLSLSDTGRSQYFWHSFSQDARVFATLSFFS